MKVLKFIIIFALIFPIIMQAQIVQPFTVYKQLTQRGDITFAANTILTCNNVGGCVGQTSSPPGSGISPTNVVTANNTSWNNNSYTMAYVDADGTAAFGGKTTFSSSRSYLDLSNNPGCSIIEAYITWGGNIFTTTTNYAKRDSVYIKAPGSATLYTGFKADFITDNVAGSGTNPETQVTYQCYKNITNEIRAGGEGDYWVSNVVANTGAINLCGGWAIVVIYGDDVLPLRNLTIYKGYANISNAAGGQNIGISGFYTPPSPTAPVNVKLGVFSFEGDQGTIGDSLKFNGAGSLLAVTDGINNQNNFFNSTIGINGVSKNAASSTYPGNPNYVNSLGFDADIVTLNNGTKTFLGNGASSATLRLTTAGDQYYPFLITTAIDIFEPNVLVTKDWVDDNGGLVQLGDVITYNIKVRNKGNDPSTKVVLTDIFYGAIDYVPGSSQILTGPNAGVKTDAINDDQVDFLSASNTLKFRLGNGANNTIGGAMGTTAATDSVTTVSFKVKITEDCRIFKCKDSVFNTAFVDFVGFTSGASRSTASSASGLDAYGCPIQGPTNLRVVVPACTSPADTTFNQCVPYNLSQLVLPRPGYTSFFNSSFSPVTQATATGTYYAIKLLYTGCTDTIQINFTQTCVLPILLKEFTAKYSKDETVLLNWQTTSETNNLKFELERSIDGINFEKIYETAGSLFSNTLKNYDYSDNNYPKFNKIFYRLIQVDIDGGKKYSEVKVVTLPSNKKFSIYLNSISPNPVTSFAAVKLSSIADGKVTYRIVNFLGKLISTNIINVKKGETLVPIDLSSFANGIYLIEFINSIDGNRVNTKFLKQ